MVATTARVQHQRVLRAPATTASPRPARRPACSLEPRQGQQAGLAAFHRQRPATQASTCRPRPRRLNRRLAEQPPNVAFGLPASCLDAAIIRQTGILLVVSPRTERVKVAASAARVVLAHAAACVLAAWRRSRAMASRLRRLTSLGRPAQQLVARLKVTNVARCVRLSCTRGSEVVDTGVQQGAAAQVVDNWQYYALWPNATRSARRPRLCSDWR